MCPIREIEIFLVADHQGNAKAREHGSRNRSHPKEDKQECDKDDGLGVRCRHFTGTRLITYTVTVHRWLVGWRMGGNLGVDT